MGNMNLLDVFDREVQCEYKGEVYSVRDNGAIMRHKKDGNKKRPKDEMWTFGNKDFSKGYMMFCKVAVHRIVAFAFLGEPPADDYVVDHIDTNRCNNRPENLRWVTKLENALNNEATLRKIIDCCGSVEAFIENPSILNQYINYHQKFDWMRTVTKEEAKNAYDNITNWAKDTRKAMYFDGGKFTDKVFEPLLPSKVITDSLTPNALQKNWHEQMEFPCCPNKKSLQEYHKNILENHFFAQSENFVYKVINHRFDKEREVIHLILSSKNPKNSYIVAMVTLNTSKKFLHEVLKEYQSLELAENHFNGMEFKLEFSSSNFNPNESSSIKHICEDYQYSYLNSNISKFDNTSNLTEFEEESQPQIYNSLTNNAIQIDWKTPTEFVLCPKMTLSLQEYYNNLSKGIVFGKNTYGESIIADFAMFKDEEAIGVVTRSNNVKRTACCKIYISGDKFAHENYSSYFDEKGGERFLIWAQGLEWTGGEIFDDLC
ncbi:MAG: HNH endonuclease [Bacteroidales bacterium]|nr:HNH endonuclease [Bacteroidales bacterium]